MLFNDFVRTNQYPRPRAVEGLLRIGIVGHRFLKAAGTKTFVEQQCRALLQQAQQAAPRVLALSAIAEGSDTIFAEVALALDIPLEIVLPFANYASDFAPGAVRERYEGLRRAARRETVLPYTTRSDAAYRAAMTWILDSSDVLVAVWDGQPVQGITGTSEAVQEAQRRRMPWIHLNVWSHSVTNHGAVPFTAGAPPRRSLSRKKT